MKTEILRLLRESEGFLSGQQLCSRFQVSRAAVWKVMEQLKDEGYEIQAVRNKGYRLVGSPDVLSREELESRIGTRWAGHHVVYFPQTDSTNLQAKAAGEGGSPHGSLFVTDRQSAGRGRRGRAWESPGGENIYMTLLLRPEFPPERASMLTLVMALAAAEGIETVCGGEVGIKWPNDLVLKGKKICGILTEMSAEVDYIHYVVIGVGINVNQDTFPEEIRETATSLRLETGKKVIRGELITEILKRFEENYEIFAGTRDLSGLREAYSRRLVNRDREVKVLDPAGAYEAHALGIDERGELIVRTREGETRKVFAGEVSVRGIYGYV